MVCAVPAAAAHFKNNVDEEDKLRQQGLFFFIKVTEELANYLHLGQETLDPDVRRVRVQDLHYELELAWIPADSALRTDVAKVMGFKAHARNKRNLSAFAGEYKNAFCYRQHAYIEVATVGFALQVLLDGPEPKTAPQWETLAHVLEIAAIAKAVKHHNPAATHLIIGRTGASNNMGRVFAQLGYNCGRRGGSPRLRTQITRSMTYLRFGRCSTLALSSIPLDT